MLENTVCDTDFRFKINPISREISNATPDKNKLVQYDHNSKRFTFEIPKIVDGFDISACNKVEVHYINIYAKDKTTTKRGVYKVEDFHTEDENAVLSWRISGNATQYKGSLNFLIRFEVCGENGKVSYKWHTKIFTGIVVKEGMDNGEVIVEEYADVLEQWKQELFADVESIEERVTALENISIPPEVYIGSEPPTNGEPIWINPDEEPEDGGAVSPEAIKQALDEYMVEHPETDPNVPDWAKQPEKPKYTAAEVGALPANTPIPEGVTDEQIKNAVDAYLTENPPSGGNESPANWVKIKSVTLSKADQVSKLEFQTDAEGNPFAYDEFFLRTIRDGEGFGATKACAATLEINKHPNSYGFKIKINNFFPTDWGDKGLYINPIRSEGSGQYFTWEVLTAIFGGTDTTSQTNAVATTRSQCANGMSKKMSNMCIETDSVENYMFGKFTLYGRNRT